MMKYLYLLTYSLTYWADVDKACPDCRPWWTWVTTVP